MKKSPYLNRAECELVPKMAYGARTLAKPQTLSEKFGLILGKSSVKQPKEALKKQLEEAQAEWEEQMADSRENGDEE